jgi:hypothetical protein
LTNYTDGYNLHKRKEKTMAMKIIPEMYNQLPTNPVEMLVISFGSQDDIAAYCSVSPQAVWNWKDRNSIPRAHVEDLSRFSGIPTWMLCPKHFNKPEGSMDAGV